MNSARLTIKELLSEKRALQRSLDAKDRLIAELQDRLAHHMRRPLGADGRRGRRTGRQF